MKNETNLSLNIEHLVKLEPRFALLAANHVPVPLSPIAPGFAALVQIIIAQQISGKAADSLWRRLNATIATVTPESFLAAGPDEWQKAGLTRPRQKTIIHCAEAILAGSLNLENLAFAHADDAINSLTKIWGIGPWTAEVYMMMVAGHPDIFPARDLALQIGLQDLLALQARPDERLAKSISAAWSPCRSIAARLIWADYIAKHPQYTVAQADPHH
jgi:DNA-3-methyladenine glycosylase II